MAKDVEFYDYLNASTVGALRGLFGLPFEHPLDCIKTHAQAKPSVSSVVEIAKGIFREKGFLGFYSGAIPNGTRIALKQAYRFPLMLQLPHTFDYLIPDAMSENKKKPVNKALTGLSIASLECLIITPLERLKVFIMTKPKNLSIYNWFFYQSKNSLSQELFRGLNALYIRQITSWVTFLVADQQFKDIARQHTTDGTLSPTQLLGVSAGVGAINTLAIMPFDTLKTQLQKNKPIENKGILNTLSALLKANGLSGLYRGWQVRMVQYMVQSVLTVNLLEKLEQTWQKPFPK